MPDGKILISRVLSAGALALAVALSGCGSGVGLLDALSSDLPRPTDYPIHGIDVSKFQGDIDWNAVADSGVKFAWIKATEGGDHADERFQANWTGAKAAGVPRGAYHFVYWCRPPMEEMAYFEQNAPVEDDALPPVLDVEATPTSKTCHRHLTQEGAIAEMKVMLDEMERHYGKRPIIYTTVDFYQAILVGRRLLGLPDLGALDEVPAGRQIRAAALEFLAIPVRRHDRRHPGPCRPRRLFRHPEAVGSLSPRRGIGLRKIDVAQARARRNSPLRTPRAAAKLSRRNRSNSNRRAQPPASSKSARNRPTTSSNRTAPGRRSASGSRHLS